MRINLLILTPPSPHNHVCVSVCARLQHVSDFIWVTHFHSSSSIMCVCIFVHLQSCVPAWIMNIYHRFPSSNYWSCRTLRLEVWKAAVRCRPPPSQLSCQWFLPMASNRTYIMHFLGLCFLYFIVWRVQTCTLQKKKVLLFIKMVFCSSNRYIVQFRVLSSCEGCSNVCVYNKDTVYAYHLLFLLHPCMIIL